MKKIIWLFAIALLLSCQIEFADLEETPKDERIFSIYCSPDEEYIDEIKMAKATHVNIFFYNLYTEESMKLTHSSVGTDSAKSNEHDAKVKSFITALKTEIPDIKVLMAIGGWDVGTPAKGNYAEFTKLKNSEEFAEAIVKRLEELTFDGFDFDLEGADIPFTIDNIAMTLSPKLKEKKMIMSAALFSTLDTFFTHFSRLSLQKLDYINVMSYNYTLASYTSTPSVSASINDFQREAAYWYRKGVALNKLVMGVPYYSQMWEKKGGIKISDGQPTYKTFYTDYLKPEDNENYYEKELEMIYKTTNEAGNDVYIDCNNIGVMREKATLARKLGGVMCWEFSQDLFTEGEGKSLSWNIQDVLFK